MINTVIVLINTVITTVLLNVFILRFLCDMWGGGGDELSLRFIVLLLHGLSRAFIVMSGDDVMCGDDGLYLRFILFPRHEL